MAKRGRRQNDDDFLAMEVHRVMRAYKCGVRVACQRIARGGRVPLLTPRWSVSKDGKPVRGKPGKWFTVGGPWEGRNAGTLEQRYFRWLRREEERQRALTLEIREFP
ncbi:MAG: hypothetical protein WAU74_01385 [Pseudolabrys sp.]